MQTLAPVHLVENVPGNGCCVMQFASRGMKLSSCVWLRTADSEVASGISIEKGMLIQSVGVLGEAMCIGPRNKVCDGSSKSFQLP